MFCCRPCQRGGSWWCTHSVRKLSQKFTGCTPTHGVLLKNMIRPNLGSDRTTSSLVRYNQIRTSTNDYIDSVSLKVVPSPIAHRTRSHQPNPAHSGSLYTPTRIPRSQKEEQPHSMEPLKIEPLDFPLHEEFQFGNTPQGSTAPPSPESSANTAETLPSEDEQIMNMALILFLDSVTIHHPTISRGATFYGKG